MYFNGEALQIVFEGPYPYESELPGTVDARMGPPGRTEPGGGGASSPQSWSWDSQR